MKYRDDYGPTVAVIWYGIDINCWDLRYDVEENLLKATDYKIRNYAL